jgi:hypothetical protein
VQVSTAVGIVLLLIQLLASYLNIQLPHSIYFLGSCSSIAEWSLDFKSTPQIFTLCFVARYFSAHRCSQKRVAVKNERSDSVKSSAKITALSEQERADRLAKALHLLSQNIKQIATLSGII